MVAGFGGGAFIFDQVQTAFINPENLSPDSGDQGERYFKNITEIILGMGSANERRRYYVTPALIGQSQCDPCIEQYFTKMSHIIEF